MSAAPPAYPVVDSFGCAARIDGSRYILFNCGVL